MYRNFLKITILVLLTLSITCRLHAQKRLQLFVQPSVGANFQSSHSVTNPYTHRSFLYNTGSENTNVVLAPEFSLSAGLAFRGWEFSVGCGDYKTILSMKSATASGGWFYRPVRYPLWYVDVPLKLRKVFTSSHQWKPFAEVGVTFLAERHRPLFGAEFDRVGRMRPAYQQGVKDAQYEFVFSQSGKALNYLLHGGIGFERQIAKRLYLRPSIHFTIGGVITSAGTLIVAQDAIPQDLSSTIATTSSSGVGFHLGLKYALW